jgi:microsomal prostaglandin-E synthase 2
MVPSWRFASGAGWARSASGRAAAARRVGAACVAAGLAAAGAARGTHGGGAALSAAAVGGMEQPQLVRQSKEGATAVRGGAGGWPPAVTLYQYASCPFCNKAQAFLEWHGIPFRRVEVNPLSKEQIAFSAYKMVPLALIEGEQVNGSGTIIDVLAARGKLPGARSADPDTDKWCRWVDDHLVHLLPPNIYRSPGEALQAFDYITTTSGDFSLLQQYSIKYAGALAMFFVAKKSREKYKLGPDPRADLFQAVERWTAEGLRGRPFHGGKQADMADLAVFGVLRSIDGNYATWKDLAGHSWQGKAAFWAWYTALKEEVASNRHN